MPRMNLVRTKPSRSIVSSLQRTAEEKPPPKTDKDGEMPIPILVARPAPRAIPTSHRRSTEALLDEPAIPIRHEHKPQLPTRSACPQRSTHTPCDPQLPSVATPTSHPPQYYSTTSRRSNQRAPGSLLQPPQPLHPQPPASSSSVDTPIAILARQLIKKFSSLRHKRSKASQYVSLAWELRHSIFVLIAVIVALILWKESGIMHKYVLEKELIEMQMLHEHALEMQQVAAMQVQRPGFVVQGSTPGFRGMRKLTEGADPAAALPAPVAVPAATIQYQQLPLAMQQQQQQQYLQQQQPQGQQQQVLRGLN